MAFSPSVTHLVGKITRQCDMSKVKKRGVGNGRKNRATSFMGFVSETLL